MPENLNNRTLKSKTNKKTITWAPFFLALFYVFFFWGYIKAQNGIKREVRAVWIATVKNIDWPSAPALPTRVQKIQAIILLDSLQAVGINTIYFQVRSSADAFYANSREPWSEWLMGRQGLAPDPFYDPLTFFIEGAHERGMEIQAWVNPYRAIFNNNSSNLISDHITQIHPEWFFKYGGRTLFNPGIPEVREYIEAIIFELVENYDLDGIHLDDYFYPYPIKGQPIPDSKSFSVYGGGFASIQDWRRENINSLIRELNEKIKQNKPYIKFGVSPFGVWRNLDKDTLGSATFGGSSFDNQYADSREWLRKGWVDYLIPQIYFSPENALVPFKKVVEWWNKNSFSRQVYIGLGLYRVGEKKEGWTNPSQIPLEIEWCRRQSHISGVALYSAHYLIKNTLGVVDSLKKGAFNFHALPPVMKWLDSVPPGAPLNPTIDSLGQKLVLKWKSPRLGSKDSSVYYLVYRFNEGEELNVHYSDRLIGIVYKKTEFYDHTAISNKKYVYLISTVDRLWNEGQISNPIFVNAPSFKWN